MALQRVLKFLELPESDAVVSTRWINDDLRPVPLERQTWGLLPHKRHLDERADK